MYDYTIHQQVENALSGYPPGNSGKDHFFFARFMANAGIIHSLYNDIYRHHPKAGETFLELLNTVARAHTARSQRIKEKDLKKQEKGRWYLSNELAGMSLYVDRFCGNLANLPGKLPYLLDLGVNLLHLMPFFKSPEGESDGGYAVADFREVDARFGTLEQLQFVQQKMDEDGMYLMIDVVLNHTSHRHDWAEKAKAGDQRYQDYFYMFSDRRLPDAYDQTMPEVFPESAPGNFTWVPECNKWVMTVFHKYQWDLNYRNPAVLVAMLDTIFFYANLGIDLLRIDAPAFIWKELGTSCQNRPEAHTLLRLIKQCVQVATPGMALLAEAIVAPQDIIPYFGSGMFTARECDFAYNAAQMALQWDALATADTNVMRHAQPVLTQKPFGTSWITYTRCHDDIGLGYDDKMIADAGYNPYLHRRFLKNYYSGEYEGSESSGALFSFNPKTGDARISGSLAALCGLEKAVAASNEPAIDLAIKKIGLMQAMSFFIGGLPMLFYGDEAGYTNDYSYLNDPAKSYDNRWMHRPIIDWNKNALTTVPGTIEYRIFSITRQLLRLRKNLPALADHSNITWMGRHNNHLAGFIRAWGGQRLFCLFNFSNTPQSVNWLAFKENGLPPARFFDHWTGEEYEVGEDDTFLITTPYGFYIFEEQS